MRYASVCDGIGAVHVAWKPLGWRCAWTSEIEPYPSAVVEHHFGYPNLGDMTRITDEQIEQHGPIDLLVGGTPCQSFSVAGLRKGLADPRGNLALDFLRLADAARARWLVWENVPGVLSSNGGRDFGSFLGAMVELGYGFAYRVLDAQYCGLAQRRKRVFVVGCLGDWRRAAAVLLERESLSGNPAPSREAGERTAGTITPGAHAGSYNGQDAYTGHLVPFDTTQVTSSLNRSNPQPGDPCHPLVSGGHAPAIAFDCKATDCQPGNVSPTMRSMNHDKSHANAGGQVAVAFQDVAQPLRTNNRNNSDPVTEARMHIQQGMAVRRLTPIECERLQGFDDNYTLIQYRNKPASDGPRYKALGNSMAVPVMRWIGQRIQQVYEHQKGIKP